MRRALKDGGLLLIVDFGTRRSWDRPEGVPASREGHGIDKDLLVSEMELAGFALVRDLPWEDGDYALFSARSRAGLTRVERSRAANPLRFAVAS